jgi:DNA-binding beta-propeller fold protein YncE
LRHSVTMWVIAVVCAAAFVGRGAGQSSALRSPSVQAPSTPVTNSPIVVASSIHARSLATNSTRTTEGTIKSALLYFTNADEPNKLLSLQQLPAAQDLKPNSGAEESSTVAGIGTPGSLGDGGPAEAAELNLRLDSSTMRSGVAVAADGTVFIADTQNATIRRIAGPNSSEPGVIHSIAGKWGPRQLVGLTAPLGLALDRMGTLYIGDHGANAVLKLENAGKSVPDSLELVANVAQPASIAVTPDGKKLYVASPETGRVLAVDLNTHSLQDAVAFADASLPHKNETGMRLELGGCSLSFCPAGLAVDGAGALFVADAAGNQILRLDSAHHGAARLSIAIKVPGDITFDSDGNLFVAEQGRSRVLELVGLGAPVNSVTLLPAAADFGVEPTHGTSPSLSFTLTNGTSTALAAVAVNNIQGTNPSDFQTISSSCLTSLAPSANCLINVGFAPTAAGPRAAQLAVTYTGAANPLTANLAGIGADYNLGLAANQSFAATVVAGNKATYNLQLTGDSNFPTGSPYTAVFVCPPIAAPTATVVPAGDLGPMTTCNFMPPTVPVSPGAMTQFSLVIETTSRSTGVLGSVPGIPGNWLGGNRKLSPLLPVLLAMVIIVWSSARQPAMRGKTTASICVAYCLLVLTAASLFTSCGGGGPRIIGTPAGTANFLIQATVQNAQGATLNVTRSLPLQLTVQ